MESLLNSVVFCVLVLSLLLGVESKTALRVLAAYFGCSLVLSVFSTLLSVAPP